MWDKDRDLLSAFKTCYTDLVAQMKESEDFDV